MNLKRVAGGARQRGLFSLGAQLALGVAAAGLLVAGCAPTELATNKSQREGAFYGDYGITGHDNVTTIKGGSLINKLSIIGDGNRVIVEDDVAMAKIEIWGSGNEIELPYGLNPYFTQVSRNGNTVRNRPAPWAGAAGGTTRTTTIVDIDESGNATMTTTPGSPVREPARPQPAPSGTTPPAESTRPGPSQATTPGQPASPAAEPTTPDNIP